jgi:hypothetical protein
MIADSDWVRLHEACWPILAKGDSRSEVTQAKRRAVALVDSLRKTTGACRP